MGLDHDRNSAQPDLFGSSDAIVKVGREKRKERKKERKKEIRKKKRNSKIISFLSFLSFEKFFSLSSPSSASAHTVRAGRPRPRRELGVVPPHQPAGRVGCRRPPGQAVAHGRCVVNKKKKKKKKLI